MTIQNTENLITDAGNDLRTSEGRIAEYEEIYSLLEQQDISSAEAKTRMALIEKIQEAMNTQEADKMMGM